MTYKMLSKGMLSSLIIASIALAVPAFADNGNHGGLRIGPLNLGIAFGSAASVSSSASSSVNLPHESAEADIHANANAAFKRGNTGDEGGNDKDQEKNEHSKPSQGSQLVLNDFRVTSLASTSATLAWRTNETADGKIFYSTSSPVATSSGSAAVAATGSSEHTASLSGLAPSTTYYAIAVSVDGAGKVATSGQISFTTAPAPVPSGDMTPPDIFGPFVFGVGTSSAEVYWGTNEPANSAVYYSTSSPVAVASTTASVFSGSFGYFHHLSLEGLAPSTTYHFVAVAADASGNQAVSAEGTFMTAGLPDTAAPVIADVTATTTATTAKVAWMTNEDATSWVWYSTSTPVTEGGSGTLSAGSSLLVRNHEADLSGLIPGTTYFYTIGSSDAAGNAATLTGGSFVTSAS